MRIKIVADVGEELNLPVNYNHLLAGVIYRFLAESDPEYASFLHEEGYRAAGKRFKLFTFSQLMAERRRITGDKIHFRSTLTWYVSSPRRTFSLPFRRHALNRGPTIACAASVTHQGCHHTAYSPFPIRDAFPVSLSDCDDHDP